MSRVAQKKSQKQAVGEYYVKKWLNTYFFETGYLLSVIKTIKTVKIYAKIDNQKRF